MAQHKLIVMTNAVEGREQEFNDWYDNVHLRDVLAVEGVVGAQRYKLAEGAGWQYLAIYDLDCDSPGEVLDRIMSLFGTDAMQASEAFDGASAFCYPASPITDYVS